MTKRIKGAFSMVVAGAVTFSLANALLGNPVSKLTEKHTALNFLGNRKTDQIEQAENKLQKQPLKASKKNTEPNETNKGAIQIALVNKSNEVRSESVIQPVPKKITVSFKPAVVPVKTSTTASAPVKAVTTSDVIEKTTPTATKQKSPVAKAPVKTTTTSKKTPTTTGTKTTTTTTPTKTTGTTSKTTTATTNKTKTAASANSKGHSTTSSSTSTSNHGQQVSQLAHDRAASRQVQKVNDKKK